LAAISPAREDYDVADVAALAAESKGD